MHQPMPDTTRPQPLQVLLVCPRGEYLDSVRDLTRDMARDTTLHWTADPTDALRRMQHAQPVLAIVDARLDRACGSALTRALQQRFDELDVMRFEERCASVEPGDPGVWHWSELRRAIAWWAQRKRPRQ